MLTPDRLPNNVFHRPTLPCHDPKKLEPKVTYNFFHKYKEYRKKVIFPTLYWHVKVQIEIKEVQFRQCDNGNMMNHILNFNKLVKPTI